MMTKTSTPKNARPGIPMAKVSALLAAFKDELHLEYKKHFLMVEGKKGARLYIALTEIVRQIDLSGWGADLEGTHPPSAPNGGVQAQLDLSDERRALGYLENILMSLNDQDRTVPTRSKKLKADSRSAALQALSILGLEAPAATTEE